MAFLRTVIRCSLHKKYGLFLNSEAVFLNQVAPKSSQSTVLANSHVSATTSSPPRDKLDITFEDARAAFKSKTTWELLRAYIVYTLCSFETLVENNMKVRYVKFTKKCSGEIYIFFFIYILRNAIFFRLHTYYIIVFISIVKMRLEFSFYGLGPVSHRIFRFF